MGSAGSPARVRVENVTRLRTSGRLAEGTAKNAREVTERCGSLGGRCDAAIGGKARRAQISRTTRAK